MNKSNDNTKSIAVSLKESASRKGISSDLDKELTKFFRFQNISMRIGAVFAFIMLFIIFPILAYIAITNGVFSS